jgi:hypothetical protein
MEVAWSRRMRWRRRGAWMWPAFVAAIAVDAVIGTELPPAGESEGVYAAALAGLVLNTLAVILLSRPLAGLLRRRRPDLPAVVARDYAGTAVIVAVALGLLAAGLVHHGRVLRDSRAMREAVVRAQAFIGDHAPAEFRGNVQWVSMFTIQSGSLYRACVPSAATGRTYCVIVDTRKPFAHSVNFDGYEPNSVFSSGIDGF